MARMASDETVLPFPHPPLPVGSAPRLLLERLVELGCPAPLTRQAALGGPVPITWDIPYRGTSGAPKWAWAILDRLPEDSTEPWSLRVDAREFALVFSETGEIIRARNGARYLSGPDCARFYDDLRLGFGNPPIAAI